MKRWIGVTSSAITGLVVAGVMALAAPPGVINAYNAICDPGFPTRCLAVDTNGAIAVTGAGGGGAGGAQLKATAADPTYVEGSTTNPLSSDLSGYMRVYAKQATSPWVVSGTVSLGGGNVPVTQASSPWTISGPVTHVAGSAVDGWDITQGAKTDARSTATDTTAVSIMQVLKEISFMEQFPASTPVTGTVGISGTAAVTQSGAWSVGQTGAPWSVTGSGSAGSAATGVVTVQGIAGGVGLPVVGNITAADDAAVTSALKAYSLMGLYDGAGIDMAREATNGLNSTGVGLQATQLVGQCDDTSPVTTTENSFGNARINCATHAQFMERLPSASAVAGIAPVASTALETGRVLKASAGNLYGVEVTTTSVAGYLQVFNLTAVPAAGAVTPVAHCYVAAFGTCALDFDPPLVMSVGISVAFSSATTPFTKTDSATAAFSGQVQ